MSKTHSLRSVLSIKLLSKAAQSTALSANAQTDTHNDSNAKEVVDNNNAKEVVDNNNAKEVVDNNNAKEVVDNTNAKEVVDNNNAKEVVDNNNAKEVEVVNDAEDVAKKIVKSVDDDLDTYTDGQDENADRSASTEVEDMLTGGSDLCGMIEKILEGGYRENTFTLEGADKNNFDENDESDNDTYDVEEEFARQLNGGKISIEAPFIGGHKEQPSTYSIINAYPYVLKTKPTSM